MKKSKKAGGGNHSGAPDTGVSPDKNRTPRTIRTSDETHEKVKGMANTEGSSIADIYGDLIEKGIQATQEGTLSKQLASSVAEIKRTIEGTYKQPIGKGIQATQEGALSKQLASSVDDIKRIIENKQAVDREIQATREGAFTEQLKILFAELERITKSNEQISRVLIEMGLRSAGTEEAIYFMFRDYIAPRKNLNLEENAHLKNRFEIAAEENANESFNYQIDRAAKGKDKFSASLEKIQRHVSREEKRLQEEENILVILSTQDMTFTNELTSLLAKLKSATRRNEQMSRILIEMGFGLGRNQSRVWRLVQHYLKSELDYRIINKLKIESLVDARERFFQQATSVADDRDKFSRHIQEYVPKGDEDKDEEEMKLEAKVKQREEEAKVKQGEEDK